MKPFRRFGLIFTFVLPVLAFASGPGIVYDSLQRTITVVDGSGDLAIRIRYDTGCVIDQLRLMGEDILRGSPGVSTTVRRGKDFRSSVSLRSAPKVRVSNSKAIISGIDLGIPGSALAETWTLEPVSNGIRWNITRSADSGELVDEAFTPDFVLPNIDAWTGALLGNGGVAWFSLFDSTHATYGVHTGSALLWKKGDHRALRIRASAPDGGTLALRFSRLPNKELALGFARSEEPLVPRYDKGLHRRRYLPAREDVWSPFRIEKGSTSIQLEICALDYLLESDPGIMPPFDAREIHLIANTIARIGVIDSRLHGGNSWRTPYGPVCLHEQYIAQLGLIMQDTNYFFDYAQTLNFYRDHAVMPDGRVKSRWAYTCEDAMPGSCDSLGFYEAQWGYLLDSNPDFVTNVAELFDFTGDMSWLRSQQGTCERVLDYILRRDFDGNGLVEMMTDNHHAARGSDWIDVIWASYENAFVNAKLYYALRLWSDLEDLLGNPDRADAYRKRAVALKAAFNRPTDEGGFWSTSHKWYIHWRDKDGSLHGDNLVTFVNFMAIAYGICDDRDRATAILHSIETQMEKEQLFFWPICMFSYASDEGIGFQFPFPSYENGDIFLSLGEVGVRAYSPFSPEIPVKYLKNLIARYRRDGLAFQRYLRSTQEGSGDDILAGNALPIVGLYRDIYGIQPKYNRLYLDPHMTAELEGTSINYSLRGKAFRVSPSLSRTSVTVAGFTLTEKQPFGCWCVNDTLQYFQGQASSTSMSIKAAPEASLTVTIERWDKGGSDRRIWRERCIGSRSESRHVISDLVPAEQYAVVIDGKTIIRKRSDISGRLSFTYSLKPSTNHLIELMKLP